MRGGVFAAQESETGDLHGVTPTGTLGLADADFQQIAGFGVTHVDRPGVRVNKVGGGAANVFVGGVLVELGVPGVAGFQDDGVSWVNGHNRRDVLVPTVVSGVRLLGEGLGLVDLDVVRCSGHLGFLNRSVGRVLRRLID